MQKVVNEKGWSEKIEFLVKRTIFVPDFYLVRVIDPYSKKKIFKAKYETSVKSLLKNCKVTQFWLWIGIEIVK